VQGGYKFGMVIERGQEYPGSFAVKENVTSLNSVRNDLAIKEAWKSSDKDLFYVQYQVKEGISLDLFRGPIGPQIDLKANRFLPGNLDWTQYELPFNRLNIQGVDRLKYIEEVPEIQKKLE
jgi:hypothetical protein